MKVTKADISRVMAALARKRKPEQCKGGRPKKADRCTCGDHTAEYAARYNLKCGPMAAILETEATMENVEQGSETFELECARAKGEQTIPEDEAPISITGAHCDYSARGSCREHWFRMAWRNDSWQYISRRLEAVGMTSSTRHQSKKGDVWAGEIVASHDRGKPIDAVALIVNRPEGVTNHILWLDFTRRRDGQLSITLPDKSTVVLRDPRKD